MKLCVFCGASTGKSPAYRLAAIELGHAMADAGIGLVYGGASVGLMGAVADAVLERGGEVMQAARPRAMEPTAAAAKIRPMGRIGFPFVGGGRIPPIWRGEPALVHGCNWDG